MNSLEVENLFNGPLVKWLKVSLKNPDSLKTYKNLADGRLLHEVFLQIDPEAVYDSVVAVDGNSAIRVNNLETVWKNVRYFYEQELGQVVLKVPDIVKLGEEPDSHVEEMRLLLTLLLGCAVQCANKEVFIMRIKAMDESDQLAIMDCIRNVTDKVDIVLSLEHARSLHADHLFDIIKRLSMDRNDFRDSSRIVAACYNLDRSEYYSICGDPRNISDITEFEFSLTSRRESGYYQSPDRNESSQQMWKLRQEQDKIREALVECIEDLEDKRATVEKLQSENQILSQKVKQATFYRDKLDMALEKAARVDELELELASYRDKLEDVEFYKQRVNELHEDNLMLIRIKETLEDQLTMWKQRAESIPELEREIVWLRKLQNNSSIAQTTEQKIHNDLFEDNLRMYNSTNIQEDADSSFISEIGNSLEDSLMRYSLSEQFTNNVQGRVLQLEVENHRLQTILQSTREKRCGKNSSMFSRLEKRCKKLASRVDKLNIVNKELKIQNNELEAACKQALVQIEILIKTAENHRRCSIENRQMYEAQKCKYETLYEKYVDVREDYAAMVKHKEILLNLIDCVEMNKSNKEYGVKLKNQDDFQGAVNITVDNSSSWKDAGAGQLCAKNEEAAASRDIRRPSYELLEHVRQIDDDKLRVNEFLQKDFLTYNIMAITAMFVFLRCFGSD